MGYEALADVTTSRNVQPDLPQTVNAVYSDGTKIAKAMSWEQIDSSLLGQAGRFVVQGTVTETGDRMSIYVIVADYIGIKDTVIVTAVGTIPQLPETVTAVTTPAKLIRWRCSGSVASQMTTLLRRAMSSSKAQWMALQTRRGQRFACAPQNRSIARTLP